MSGTDSTSTTCNRIVIDLDAAASSRLLEQAARRRAPVVLTYRVAGAEESVAGCLHAVEPGVLHVGTSRQGVGPLATTYADGSLDLEGEEYLFSTVVLGESAEGHGRLLAIARPVMLQTWQRRRFVRAELAESALVSIFPVGGANLPAGEGVMLNVSPDGLAFRTDRQSADQWSVDDRVRVEFALRPAGPRLELQAMVRTKTPAGTPGSIIVGVQFSDAAQNAAPRNALKQALRAFVGR